MLENISKEKGKLKKNGILSQFRVSGRMQKQAVPRLGGKSLGVGEIAPRLGGKS